MAEATIDANPSPVASAKNLLDLPAVRQGLLLAGIAAAIAIGIATVLWTRAPDYSLLYSNLADRDAGAVVNALQAATIPYEFDQASGAILVPASRVHEARLKLAADGLPQGSGLGFELMGEEQGFGVSQFMENARYQHMLETELVRTIASLRPVRGARVHLAMPKQSVFVRDRRPASASVMVELFPGRRLEDSQVAAIVHMIASSIPDLETGNITVVDQSGRLLTDADSSAELALTTQQFEYKTRVEDSYTRRIEEMLIPLVGADQVRAQVTAEMDFTMTEQTLESYDSADPALRSEQSSSQTRLGGTTEPVGVPGALTNQPPGADDLAAAANAQSSSNNAVRNYELDRSVSHVRQPVGTIRRLSVAVIVDERQTVAEDGSATSTPLTPTELERMTTLVREAVGFDEARGDTVNVINAPFMAPAELEPTQAAWWEMPLVQQALRQVVGLILILGVIFGLLRPVVRHLLAPPRPSTALLTGGAPAEYLPSGPRPVLSYEERLNAARSLVGEDPRRAARVVKDWVAEDE
ncbi:MAG: flagellar M-ring protein FliF [Gammaproteobacteria bacterium]|nr:flagellar M-ring protein FliF [Gammaproteobacteria bacterium]